MLPRRTVWTPEKAAERDALHERIAAHFLAGKCHILKMLVADGAPMYGPTGAHWECHSDPIEKCEPPREQRQDQHGPKPDMHPRMARANGGSLVHFVIQATGTSLCGHKPKDTAHHMKQRGKWLVWKNGATVPAHMKQFPKCVAKARALYPLVEDESV